MKILLDENLDVRFKNYFPGNYQVFTVRDMQWNGIKNGQLLSLLEKNNFDVWIVIDKNIPYQQNISTLPCFVVVLDVYRNTLAHLIPLIPGILETLNDQSLNKIAIIS